jgi:hypothetical protein
VTHDFHYEARSLKVASSALEIPINRLDFSRNKLKGLGDFMADSSADTPMEPPPGRAR